MAIIRRHKSTVYGLETDLTNLNNADTTEAGARAAGDATLQTNIDNEATARSTADAGLQTQIDTLSTTATDLQTQINGNDTDITAIETTIGALTGLSTTDKSSVVNSINELYTAQQIKLEAQDIPPIVIAYTGVLTNLTTTNQNSLVEAINEVDAEVAANLSTVNAAIAAETTARTTADTTLQTNIDNEETARIAGDAALQTSVNANATAISDEATARATADTTLQGNIDAETTARTNADNTLQSNIDSETASRIAADNTLSGRLDVIEGDSSTEGSVAKAKADAKAYADTILASSEGSASSTYLAKSSNLGDLTDVAAARTNLEVMSSTEIAAAINAAELAMGTNYDVVDIAARDALVDLDLADRVFVQNDGDSKWALYKVSGVDGNGAGTAWTKIGDQDALENSLTADGVKAAYESNANTNAFTDAEKAQLATNTTDIDALQSDVADNITDIANNVTAIAANASAITSEATARANADTTLQGNIDAETTARTNADNTLQSNIDTVAGNLSTETTNRTSADAAIQAELDATQTGAGLGVDGSYTANATSNYITTATSLVDSDNKLDAAIKAVADSVVTLEGAVGGDTGDLASLTTDAKDTLVAAINEIDGHADANATAISNETSARTSADAALQSAINTNATAISNETTARTGADNTLQANIDAEEAARIAADALDLKIASNLSDVENVATARTNLGVYSTSEVDSAIATATANIMNVVSEQVVVSGDLITVSEVPANGVILNFNTVRYVDENGNSFDIPVTLTATAGAKEFQLHGDSAGQFDTKTITVQYMYQ
jgi:hypothetical protein